MLFRLLNFELQYHTRKILFAIAALAFTFFGFALTAGGLRFPNILTNAPYLISYRIGILSMGIVFAVALFTANAVLKDKEFKYDQIIYTTSISKFEYLFSRFLGVFLVSLLAFSFSCVGMIISRFMPWIEPERMDVFNIINYLWPLVTISIPNILICTSLVFLLAVLSNNRMAIYTGGLGIYILYFVGTIFSNSPMMGNASPASSDAMSIAALLDPFGISAFFEQTRYWSIATKNNQLISLSGNFLKNRLFWSAISILLLIGAYFLFSFRKLSTKVRKITNEEVIDIKKIVYSPVTTFYKSFKAQWKAFLSLSKIEFITIIKDIPFLVIIILFIFLVGIESISMVEGGRRLPDNYPLTAKFLANILELIPRFGTMVILFYSSEQIWKGKSIKINSLIDTTAVSNATIFFSKYAVLSFIPFVLLNVSILISIVTQIIYGYYEFELLKYLSLYYYVGVPFLLISVLVLFVQSIVSNKYLGLILTGTVLLVLCSKLRFFIGSEHILLRFAPFIYPEYSDINGFGNYVNAFNWLTIYSTSIAGILIILMINIWNRGIGISLKSRVLVMFNNFKIIEKVIVSFCLLAIILSGSYIFYQTNIQNNYKNDNEKINWALEYEKKYKSFSKIPSPVITDVKANVDLFPNENRYEVNGTYIIQNKTEEPLSKVLLSIHKNTQLQSVDIENAVLEESDERFGHYWLSFKTPLQPKASTKMTFKFNSSWSPFLGHEAFNAIIKNGSFLRMSRYFPYFGYDSEKELQSQVLRKENGLPERNDVTKKLDDVLNEDYDPNKYDYEFINFEAIVSTSLDQRAIAPGNLLNSWTNADRNYFHYKMDRPIPFRFAFSSGTYKVKKEHYKGVDLEIYYLPGHAFNIDKMMGYMKQTMDYCTSNYGPYQYKHLRNVEISEFTGGFAATAYPNTLYMIENRGFLSNLSDKSQPNIVNLLMGHEIAHQWWGGQVDPETREGGLVLTETIAQYTEQMIYEKTCGKTLAIEALDLELDLYLSDRGFNDEKPLYKSVSKQPYVHYSKGLLILNAIKNLIGESNVNDALKSIVSNYSYPKNPPSVYDLIRELKNNSPEIFHQQIEDWFTKIEVYDLGISNAKYKTLSNGKHEISLEIFTQKEEENGKGNKESIPIDDGIEIGIYSKNENGIIDRTKFVYIDEFQFDDEKSQIKIVINQKPEEVIIDPFITRIDKNRNNNRMKVEEESALLSGI